MPLARKTVVDVDQVGVYHCISRCVRRAFLCGLDEYSGIDYEHRRSWIADRLKELYCEHFRVISDFCAMLLNFAKADIRPILKDNMKMRAINYLISELLHEVESDSRRKFYHLICEQMALTMPIYKILKLVVRQHTPEMENRKNGGLARWKSKQSPKNILVPVMRCRSD